MLIALQCSRTVVVRYAGLAGHWHIYEWPLVLPFELAVLQLQLESEKERETALEADLALAQEQVLAPPGL